jgi:hypothetical protein
MKPANFPVVEGFDGGQEDFAPFLLDTESAKAISKALPRKTTIPVLQYAAVRTTMVQKTDENNQTSDTDKVKSVQICVTDLERPQVFRPHVPEGQFPNYAAVIPDFEKDVVFEINVNPKLLGTICKAMADLQKEKAQPIMRLKFYKQDIVEADKARDGQRRVYDRAIRVDGTNSDTGQGMTCVLMPMRDSGDIPGTYGYKEREARRERNALQSKIDELKAVEAPLTEAQFAELNKLQSELEAMGTKGLD